MARAEFADRCVTTPPRGLETQISSDLQRLTQSPQHQRNCHSENQARWHFFKAQSSTAANCAAHSRISNEIPTFDAIFSMAASVLFRVLAMRGSGCFLAANFRSLRNSSSVQRTATLSGTPKFEVRAITAADNFWLARTLNWRISSLVQVRCLKDFFFRMMRPGLDLFAMFTLLHDGASVSDLRDARMASVGAPDGEFLLSASLLRHRSLQIGLRHMFPSCRSMHGHGGRTGLLRLCRTGDRAKHAHPNHAKKKKYKIANLFHAGPPAKYPRCELVRPFSWPTKRQRAAACALLAGIIRKPQRAKS